MHFLSAINPMLMTCSQALQVHKRCSFAKVFLKKVSFELWFKCLIVIVDLSDWGTAFHKVGADTLKD